MARPPVTRNRESAVPQHCVLGTQRMAVAVAAGPCACTSPAPVVAGAGASLSTTS